MSEVPQTTTGAELDQVKRDVVDVVAGRVRSLVMAGELHLPDDYSAENASKAAWLILQGVQDRNNKNIMVNGALTGVVTPNSVANALLAMVTQGLDPQKGQCYFIPYGNQLVCQRSYFGAIAVYKRVCGTKSEIFAEVVYEGDKLTYSIERGRKVITGHEQELDNVDDDKIVAVYAVAEPEGMAAKTTIMTLAEITKAWEMGQMKGKSGAHKNFTGEMAKKTVIQRVLKAIINSSSDSHLVMASRTQDSIVAEAGVEVTAEEEGNKELLALTEPKDVAIKDVTPTASEPEASAAAEGEEEESSEGPAGAEAEAQEGHPKERFQALVDENEFDLTLAKRLAAEMSGLDDLRQLGNDELSKAIEDPDRFVAEYLKRNPPVVAGQTELPGGKPGF